MEAIPDMVITHTAPQFMPDRTIEGDLTVDGTYAGAFGSVLPSNRRARIADTDILYSNGATIIQHEVVTNYDTFGRNGIIVDNPDLGSPIVPEDENGPL